MTFKEYFDLIGKQVFAITEHCQNLFVAHHTVFGFIDDPGGPGHGDFYLIGDGQHLPTHVDALQNVQIKENSIFVVDRYANKIQLTFRASTIIPHPAQ